MFYVTISGCYLIYDEVLFQLPLCLDDISVVNWDFINDQ